jgi:O-antigen/teichoic acid export membrane protein
MKDLKGIVLRGGLVTGGGQIAKMLLRVVSLAILARLLEPRDFGLVGMVTAITGVLDVIKDAGLSTVTVQRPTITDEQISSLFWLNMLVGTVLALMSIGLAPSLASFYGEPRLLWLTVALSPGFVLNAAAVQHSALLQRSMRFVALTTTELVSLAVGVVVGVGMALTGFGYWALVGLTIAQTAASAVLVWAATRWIPNVPRRNAGIGDMLRFGGTVSLNSLVVYIAYNFEKVLLGRFWGADALGIYGRAYQLISLPTQLLNSSVGSVAFPALSRLHDDSERFRSYFLKGYSLVLAFTLPLTIGCAVFAEDIILVLLGPKWHGAAVIFRLLTPTILVLALINPLAWLLFSLGLVGRSLRVALVISPIVLVAYVVGLPHGPNGVAFAYSTAMTLWLVPHIIWCTHGTMITLRDILRVAGRFLLAAAVAAVVALVAQTWLAQLRLPILRLAVGGTILTGTYVWTLLYALGQKNVYLDLARGLFERPSPVESSGSAR